MDKIKLMQFILHFMILEKSKFFEQKLYFQLLPKGLPDLTNLFNAMHGFKLS